MGAQMRLDPDPGLRRGPHGPNCRPRCDVQRPARPRESGLHSSRMRDTARLSQAGYWSPPIALPAITCTEAHPARLWLSPIWRSSLCRVGPVAEDKQHLSALCRLQNPGRVRPLTPAASQYHGAKPNACANAWSVSLAPVNNTGIATIATTYTTIAITGSARLRQPRNF